MKLQWKQTLTVPTGSALALLVLLVISAASAWAARDDLVSARRHREANQAELQRLSTALEQAGSDRAAEVQSRQSLLASFKDELGRQAETTIRDHYREQKVMAAAAVESLALVRQGIAVRCRVTAEGKKPWNATVTFARRAGRWVVVSFTEER